MATHDYPDDLIPQSVSWGIQKAGSQSRSPYGGGVQAIEFPGSFWKASLTLPEAKLRDGSAGEAFFSRIAGGVERLRMPYWPRLTPRGTMRGFPTVAVAPAWGALELTLQTTAGATLKRGDMFGAGAQVFQVFADAQANGFGVIVVPLVNRVRASLPMGTAVVWNRPTALFCLPSFNSSRSYSPGVADALSVELEEV